ncbi:AraC family transcriptional regulator [Dyella caseinilytica]|uniref:AraC family transcriptional regulator n=1 Tax=Dyella caseinilytica TaxID=1849581 RepID=A0ABX7GXX0_9GAMM|nr:AraC family transcriptional regulator [Dyella caseinilytica]QRN55331.1 AraC family transcriptional regulator [Dyella caseinilytica]GGA00978.1 AraC family transcriptional regulator [Dyella caseinilytica]
MPNALLEIVRHHTDTHPGVSPLATAVDGLYMLRSDHEKLPSHLIFKPALCVVVQGAKWTIFGDRRFDYRAGQALVVSVEMPAFSRVAEASPTEPYLGVIIEFDLKIMSEVLEELDVPPEVVGHVGQGVFVTDFDGPLADCVLRMVRLLDTPKAIPMIAPMIMREIYYWLLTGPHGGEIAKIALASSHTHRVINAIYTLRDQFKETLRIEDLAAIAQLSASAFHRQFKALTSMTPLQYQKQLRLLEARHLLAAGAANVETAALQVGYESPSQFSREYARMFGAPPRRDIAALRSHLRTGT